MKPYLFPILLLACMATTLTFGADAPVLLRKKRGQPTENRQKGVKKGVSPQKTDFTLASALPD